MSRRRFFVDSQKWPPSAMPQHDDDATLAKGGSNMKF
jgi:hypothetical protein